MAATVVGIHQRGDHASRPAANAAGQPFGSIYSCTTHNLLYITDGSTWTTYATLGDPIVGSHGSLQITVDGGGSTITTGVKGNIEVPFACTITGVRLLADASGSIVFDIWKDTYANYPPTIADTIVASAKPTITTATKSQDTTLTGWTTSLSEGDILRFNVDSVTTHQRVTLVLDIVRA